MRAYVTQYRALAWSNQIDDAQCRALLDKMSQICLMITKHKQDGFFGRLFNPYNSRDKAAARAYLQLCQQEFESPAEQLKPVVTLLCDERSSVRNLLVAELIKDKQQSLWANPLNGGVELLARHILNLLEGEGEFADVVRDAMLAIYLNNGGYLDKLRQPSLITPSKNTGFEVEMVSLGGDESNKSTAAYGA